MNSVSFCYRKAAIWTARSDTEIENGSILKSWAYSMPARLFFLCDIVENIARSVIFGLRLVYGSIEGLITWGHYKSNFVHGYKGLYHSLNHIVGSCFGTVFTQYGVKYRNFSFLLVVVSVATIAISSITYVNMQNGNFSLSFLNILPLPVQGK
jgi:hypothetical protein